MAIVYCAENFQQEIFKRELDLTEIVKKAYPKNGDKLLEYVRERKETFSKMKKDVEEQEAATTANGSLLDLVR